MTTHPASAARRVAGTLRLIGFASAASLASIFGAVRPAAAWPDPVVSSVDVGGETWTLRAVAEPVTLADGPGQLVRYTVRRGGAFVHPAARDGGRLIGLRRRHTDPSEVRVDVLPGRDRPLGWLLSVLAGAGSGVSHRFRVVTFDPAHPRAYHEHTFDAKRPPVQTAAADGGLYLWALVQDYGRGGTAVSILVPFRVRVFGSGRLKRAPLDAALDAWPTLAYPLSFSGVFVAGLRERNADLMERALAALYDPADGDEYQAYGLPADREALTGLVDVVRRAAAIERRLEQALGDREGGEGG